MKRSRRKSVDPAQSTRYRHVAAALLKSAQDLQEIGTFDDSYGNAIAIVAIHMGGKLADTQTVT